MADFPMTVSFVDQDILFLIGLAIETTSVGTFCELGKLHGIAHGGSLLEHLTAFLGVQHHAFRRCADVAVSAEVPRNRRIARWYRP